MSKPSRQELIEQTEKIFNFRANLRALERATATPNYEEIVAKYKEQEKEVSETYMQTVKAYCDIDETTPPERLQETAQEIVAMFHEKDEAV